VRAPCRFSRSRFREPPNRQQIRALKQANAVVEREPLARAKFVVDVVDSGRVES
jgi:hypothetical protein